MSQDAGVERAAILRLVSAELVGGTAGDSGGKVVLASNTHPDAGHRDGGEYTPTRWRRSEPETPRRRVA